MIFWPARVQKRKRDGARITGRSWRSSGTLGKPGTWTSARWTPGPRSNCSALPGSGPSSKLLILALPALINLCFTFVNLCPILFPRHSFRPILARTWRRYAALLDPSTAIRSIAQFYLPKLESIDVRSFYRDTVIGGEPRVLKAALGGLGETGQTTDAGLVLPLTHAPEPSVRKAALVSLAKLAMDAHIEIFVTALQSSSPGVSRQARIALERCAASVGADRLETIFSQTPHPHVRKQTVSLINHLPKWQKLPLLIDIFGGPDAETQKLAHYHICRWFQNFNRTHQVQPTKAGVVRLQVALEAHGSKFERTLERELRATVASFAARE